MCELRLVVAFARVCCVVSVAVFVCVCCVWFGACAVVCVCRLCLCFF